MTDNLGSYQSLVAIDRPDDASGSDGAEYIDYWTNAIVSDLMADLNNLRGDVIGARTPIVAAKAQRWFRDAWTGGHECRYPITAFALRIFSQPGQQGRILAEIDVLTGKYETY